MKKVLFLVIFLSFTSFLFAQKTNGVVKGTLKDSISGQSLSDATISLMDTKDSSLISFTLSSNSGYFEIKSIATGNYLVLVSHEGFQTIKTPLAISEAVSVADLGTVKMQQDVQMLNEVIVQSDVPIRVKGDTIAYNANSFKVLNPNGTAEDLLKKLPGVQVDRDGTVKAQGETVQKVYVDGKEFFGNDPQMATKNLTADMIDQVEVYDDMSEQAKFSGVDDGSRSKVMNFKLKKDKKKGMFGRATAGYGTDDRYAASVSANYFKGNTKVSVISRANNTNNLGFTNNDMLGIYSGNSGGGRGGRGGGGGYSGSGGSSSGITKNWTAGLNYSDVYSPKLELTGSYFFNHINTSNASKSYSQNFLKTKGASQADSTVNKSQQGFSNNNNNNHRVNLRLIYSIDSMNSIVYIPSFNFQNSDSYRNDTTESYHMIDKGDSVKANDSRSFRDNNGSGYNWSNNLTFRHKTSKLGRTFSVTLNNSINNSDRNGSTNSRIGYFNVNGDKTRDSIINQISQQHNNSQSYGINLSYTEPLARDKILEFNYSHNKNKSESDRRVYDFDSTTDKYDHANFNQTNLFQNCNESDRVGTNFRVVKKKYNYQFGLAAQRTTLQSNNISKSTLLDQSFTNLFPTASFNYQFARSKSLRFMYRGSTNQPSTSQLQETTDKNNPLYWAKGNAGLKQEYNNNLFLTYNFFDMVSFRNYFFRLSFSNTYDKIVDNIISGPAFYKGDTVLKGTQLTVPVNANGAYNVNGNFNIGFPIKRMKGGNFNTTTSVGYSRDISFVDSVENFTKNLNLGENLRLSYTYKEKLDISFGVRVNFTSAQYTLNANRSNSYYSYMASGDISYIFPKNFILQTDIDYTGNSGLANGYNQAYYLWNASFSKQMLKNNRGQLKLSVFDILKQNRSISRNFGSNYIEDVQNSTVQRFFMLTFTYNLSRMGSGNNGGMQRMRGEGGGGGRNYRMMQ